MISKLTSWPLFRSNCSGEILIWVMTVNSVLVSNAAVSCVVHLSRQGKRIGVMARKNVLENDANGLVTALKGGMSVWHIHSTYSRDLSRTHTSIKETSEIIEQSRTSRLLSHSLSSEINQALFCSTRLYIMMLKCSGCWNSVLFSINKEYGLGLPSV